MKEEKFNISQYLCIQKDEVKSTTFIFQLLQGMGCEYDVHGILTTFKCYMFYICDIQLQHNQLCYP